MDYEVFASLGEVEASLSRIVCLNLNTIANCVNLRPIMTMEKDWEVQASVSAVGEIAIFCLVSRAVDVPEKRIFSTSSVSATVPRTDNPCSVVESSLVPVEFLFVCNANAANRTLLGASVSKGVGGQPPCCWVVLTTKRTAVGVRQYGLKL